MNVTLFAWEHHIPLVKRIGMWNGYQVYRPSHVNDEDGAAPAIILANDAEVRFASGPETAACLGCMPS